MRRHLLIGIAVVAGHGGAVAAAATPVRSVQLITMGQRTSAPPAARIETGREDAGLGEGGAGEGAAVLADAELPDDFKVHDLSRRWVEHQMASDFGPTVSLGSALPGLVRPLGSGGVELSGSDPYSAGVATVSGIAVPAWMRGGRLFATAAASFVPGCIPTDYRPSGLLGRAEEARRQAYYAIMSGIACQHGIPVGLFDAMIIRESRYNAAIYSPKRAFGLTQLMPGTAAGLGVDRYDVTQNLRGGARYLRQQLDRFGQYHLALAAYNAGPGRVRNGLVPRIEETEKYVANILLNWSRLSGLGRIATVTPAPYSARRPRPYGRSAVVETFGG